jgi:hypothetical protein
VDVKRRHVDKSKRRKGSADSAPTADVDLSTFRLVDVSTPDMTRKIMGRLGYMRVSPTMARRQRVRSWLGRAGTFFVAAVAVAIAARVYEDSNTVRRTMDVTVPAAIGSDFQEHQHRIGNVIRTFRHLTAPPSYPAVEEQSAPAETELNAPGDADHDLVEPGLLAFRWV